MKNNPTIESLKSSYQSELSNVSSTPILELDILISFVLEVDRQYIYTHPETIITAKQYNLLTNLVKRRLAHEPIAYIIGQKEFMGHKFQVNNHTLIPRPESEELVEFAYEKLRKLLENKSKVNVFDIGTGSGCIVISLAHLHITNVSPYDTKNVSFFASDTSSDAIKVAKRNSKTILKKTLSIQFLVGNLLEPYKKTCPDIIIANLPYISTKELITLSNDVSKYEPHSALDGGIDGLALIKELIQSINKKYNNEMVVLLEIHEAHKKPLTKFIQSLNRGKSINFKFIQDLFGKDRYVCMEFNY